MKNNRNIFLLLAICSVLVAEDDGKPTYEALKVFEPLIGDWEGKSETLGIFEGLPDRGTKKRLIKRHIDGW